MGECIVYPYPLSSIRFSCSNSLINDPLLFLPPAGPILIFSPPTHPPTPPPVICTEWECEMFVQMWRAIGGAIDMFSLTFRSRKWCTYSPTYIYDSTRHVNIRGHDSSNADLRYWCRFVVAVVVLVDLVGLCSFDMLEFLLATHLWGVLRRTIWVVNVGRRCCVDAGVAVWCCSL